MKKWWDKDKILVYDVETGGFDPKKDALLSVSGLIIVDGEERESFDFFMQPVEGKNVSDSALEVNGFTHEQLADFDTPEYAYLQLKKIFECHVFNYNKKDKMTMLGYNVGFDLSFLSQFWTDMGDRYLGSYADFRKYIDVWDVVKLCNHMGLIPDLYAENKWGKMTPSFKLGVVADYFGIEFDAHKSLEDCRATWLIYRKCRELLGYPV